MVNPATCTAKSNRTRHQLISHNQSASVMPTRFFCLYHEYFYLRGFAPSRDSGRFSKITLTTCWASSADPSLSKCKFPGREYSPLKPTLKAWRSSIIMLCFCITLAAAALYLMSSPSTRPTSPSGTMVVDAHMSLAPVSLSS